MIFNACLLCSYSTMCLATHGFLSVNNVLTSSSCCLTFPHGFHTGLTVLLTVSICDNGQVPFFNQAILASVIAQIMQSTSLLSIVSWPEIHA